MADYGQSGQDYGGYHGDISGGNYGAGNPRDPYGGNDPYGTKNKDKNTLLPPEYANIQLPDGRTLGDVLGPGYFGVGGTLGNAKAGPRGDPAVIARILAERKAQANRLGATQTILGGRPPTAGKAGQQKTAPSTLSGGGTLAGAESGALRARQLFKDLILSGGA